MVMVKYFNDMVNLVVFFEDVVIMIDGGVGVMDV